MLSAFFTVTKIPNPTGVLLPRLVFISAVSPVVSGPWLGSLKMAEVKKEGVDLHVGNALKESILSHVSPVQCRLNRPKR